MAKKCWEARTWAMHWVSDGGAATGAWRDPLIIVCYERATWWHSRAVNNATRRLDGFPTDSGRILVRWWRWSLAAERKRPRGRWLRVASPAPSEERPVHSTDARSTTTFLFSFLFSSRFFNVLKVFTIKILSINTTQNTPWGGRGTNFLSCTF